MKNKLILACLLALSTLTSIGQTIYINEVDADQAGTDTGEFVELYGTPNTSLNGYTLVLFNGNDDLSYAAYGLDGYSLDENGFFVLGNSAVPNMDMLLPANGLQNGADAVALYEGSADDFPNDSPLTSDDLLDYMVYDTDDEDDEVLLALLMAGGQLNENELGNGDTHSNSRMPDGGTVDVSNTNSSSVMDSGRGILPPVSTGLCGVSRACEGGGSGGGLCCGGGSGGGRWGGCMF